MPVRIGDVRLKSTYSILSGEFTATGRILSYDRGLLLFHTEEERICYIDCKGGNKSAKSYSPPTIYNIPVIGVNIFASNRGFVYMHTQYKLLKYFLEEGTYSQYAEHELPMEIMPSCLGAVGGRLLLGYSTVEERHTHEHIRVYSPNLSQYTSLELGTWSFGTFNPNPIHSIKSMRYSHSLLLVASHYTHRICFCTLFRGILSMLSVLDISKSSRHGYYPVKSSMDDTLCYPPSNEIFIVGMGLLARIKLHK